MKKPQFVIAAPTSNAGKTTVTLGLLRALKDRGLSPQSFKCGPDYIDPKFHEVAGQKIGINLDLYLMSEPHMHETYASYSKDTGAICVEGVMGLFDGAVKSEGSTAEIAKSLQLPIILVIDAKAVAYSVAPLLYGFKNFDPSLQIAGVIFNRVNTESHYRFLVEACEDVGVRSLGYLPFLEDCTIPSRHLGLSIDQMAQYDPIIARFASQLEQTVDIDQLLKTCTLTPPVDTLQKELEPEELTIAVASDEAFNFSYHQNLESFKRIGKVISFSPIHDQALPQADLVYFPGGYPELHLDALAQNHAMLQDVKAFGESGGAILAECGGLMYLGATITNKEDNTFQMVNLFNFNTSMKAMKLNLGYRKIIHGNVVFKGHEFHYSTIENDEETEHIGTVKNARSATMKSKMYRYKNVLSTYIHLYFGQYEDLNELIKLVGLGQKIGNKKHEI